MRSCALLLLLFQTYRTIWFVYEFVSFTFQNWFYCFIEKRRFLYVHTHQQPHGGITDCVCCAFEALVLPTVAATHYIHELFVFVSTSLYRILNRQNSLRIRFNCTVALIRSSFIHENTKRSVSSWDVFYTFVVIFVVVVLVITLVFRQRGIQPVAATFFQHWILNFVL